jgi:hypothetical protein
METSPESLERLNVQVERDSLHFLMTYESAPTGHDPFKVTVSAGRAATIYLPIEQNGPSIMVVANGNDAGASVGTIRSIEVVEAPAASP